MDSNKGKIWNMLKTYTVLQSFVISYLPTCILILKIGNVFCFVFSVVIHCAWHTGNKSFNHFRLVIDTGKPSTGRQQRDKGKRQNFNTFKNQLATNP